MSAVDRWFDVGGVVFITAALVLLLAFGAIGAAEGVQAIRSHDAVVACRAKRMEPMRAPLSAAVTCVPFAERQDTTTVRVQP